MEQNEEKTVTLATFTDVVQASIAKDNLATAGIKSFLIDENLLGLDPVGGTELKIFEKDIEAAKTVLS